jgi:hypothetical protein
MVEAGAELGSLQPIAGRFDVDEEGLLFTPRFPFLAGTSYTLVVRGTQQISHDFDSWRIQRQTVTKEPTTQVVAIYPTADEVPVNLLRIYVHFSSPMSEGWALRSVHVRRADNNEPLEHVFLDMEPELWDPQRKRLTLLLDPGRIKRGLVPNEEAGYPLIEGVPIVVTVDRTFRDAEGQPLQAIVERRYRVSAPLRSRIIPADWQVHAPAAASRQPLIIEFGCPLDHALLLHSLRVREGSSRSLNGRTRVGTSELSWEFEPELPWNEGRYQVVIDPRLEDLAGNSLIRVFDRDLTLPEDDPGAARPSIVEFEVIAP